MIYEVYFRRVTDGRAPERVSLVDEYRRGGEVTADSIRLVEHKLLQQLDTTSKLAGESRRILIGDIVIEKVTKRPRIYTPSGAWADVKLVS